MGRSLGSIRINLGDDGEAASVDYLDPFCYSKIRGVSHNNEDGSSRQSIIRNHCRDGDPLNLVRDPTNPHDPNAIQVWTVRGHMVGFIGSELAQELTGLMEDGHRFTASISEITGRGREALGVNIQVWEAEDGNLADPRSSAAEKNASARGRKPRGRFAAFARTVCLYAACMAVVAIGVLILLSRIGP